MCVDTSLSGHCLLDGLQTVKSACLMCELQLQGAEPVVFALVAKYKGAVLQNIYMQRAIWDDNGDDTRDFCSDKVMEVWVQGLNMCQLLLS